MQRCRPQVCAGVLGVAAFLISVAGCQHVGSSSVLPGLTTGFDESSGKLKPKQAADVQIALARSLEMHDEPAKALALYEEAVNKDPSRSDAWLRMAILHDRQGQFAESATLYQKALKAHPGNAEIYSAMGYSLYLQQRWPEAEMNLRQALALQPDHARTHNNLGLLLARIGKEEEALDEFHKAGCSDADAHVNLAFALTLERHWPDACRHYQEALLTDPSSAPAKKGLHELEQLIARMNSPATGTPAKVSGSAIAQAHGTTSSVPAPSPPTLNDMDPTKITPLPVAATPFAAFSPR
jgi:tetratricopeptide (TPR) repeat protein